MSAFFSALGSFLSVMLLAVLIYVIGRFIVRPVLNWLGGFSFMQKPIGYLWWLPFALDFVAVCVALFAPVAGMGLGPWLGWLIMYLPSQMGKTWIFVTSVVLLIIAAPFVGKGFKDLLVDKKADKDAFQMLWVVAIILFAVGAPWMQNLTGGMSTVGKTTTSVVAPTIVGR